jgi:hypothetical protein
MLAHGVEAEVTDVLAKHADLKARNNRQRLVGHCYPARRLATANGPALESSVVENLHRLHLKHV